MELAVQSRHVGPFFGNQVASFPHRTPATCISSEFVLPVLCMSARHHHAWHHSDALCSICSQAARSHLHHNPLGNAKNWTTWGRLPPAHRAFDGPPEVEDTCRKFASANANHRKLSANSTTDSTVSLQRSANMCCIYLLAPRFGLNLIGKNQCLKGTVHSMISATTQEVSSIFPPRPILGHCCRLGSRKWANEFTFEEHAPVGGDCFGSKPGQGTVSISP